MCIWSLRWNCIVIVKCLIIIIVIVILLFLWTLKMKLNAVVYRCMFPTITSCKHWIDFSIKGQMQLKTSIQVWSNHSMKIIYKNPWTRLLIGQNTILYQGYTETFNLNVISNIKGRKGKKRKECGQNWELPVRNIKCVISCFLLNWSSYL